LFSAVNIGLGCVGITATCHGMIAIVFSTAQRSADIGVVDLTATITHVVGHVLFHVVGGNNTIHVVVFHVVVDPVLIVTINHVPIDQPHHHPPHQFDCDITEIIFVVLVVYHSVFVNEYSRVYVPTTFVLTVHDVAISIVPVQSVKSDRFAPDSLYGVH
jgi:hypothetical protein